MVSVKKCTHIELYDLSYSYILRQKNKFVLCLCLSDITKGYIVKKVHVTMTNLMKLMKSLDISSMSELSNKTVRCLINPDREVNYIGFNQNEWVICKEISDV